MEESSASVLPLLILLLEVLSVAAESVVLGILVRVVLGNLDESVAARGGGLREGWWALIGEAAAEQGF